MKISKKTRDEAALICAIAACEPMKGGTIYAVAASLGLGDSRSEQLAAAARGFVREHLPDYWLRPYAAGTRNYEFSCAEAEALLRTGWAP